MGCRRVESPAPSPNLLTPCLRRDLSLPFPSCNPPQRPRSKRLSRSPWCTSPRMFPDSTAADPPVQLTPVVARGVLKTYGHTLALRGIDATLPPESITLVVGPNGSGKTTFLSILGTVLKPTAGAVSYGAAREDVQVVRRALGWVSHEPLTYPDLTARQNIELSARLHGLDPGAVWEMADERFALSPFGHRPVRTCSRGQRQRIALARSLVHRPTLILLDEPTAGLDAEGVTRLLAAIRAEHARGAAVAIVTHEPDLFAALATAKLQFDRGRLRPLEASDPPTHLVAEPQVPFHHGPTSG